MIRAKKKPADSNIPASPDDHQNSRNKQKHSKPFVTRKRLLYLSFLSCMVVWFLLQQQAQLTVVKNVPKLNKFKIEPLVIDKGLCPRPTVCTDWKPIRSAWEDPWYSSAAEEALNEPTTNQWAQVKFDDIGSSSIAFDFAQRVRDPSLDTIISGTLVDGNVHDRDVVQEIASRLKAAARRRNQQLRKSNQHPKINKRPILLDIGANIGFMTSIGLSMGAWTISFEPTRTNLGCLLATIRANGWEEHSYVVHNAVSNEPSIVTMKSTEEEWNLSNFAVNSAFCKMDGESDTPQPQRLYGVDYMESVTIDQVLGEKFLAPPDGDPQEHKTVMDRIDVVKIDVERFEIYVIEGMMRTLCHVPIDAIVVEVEYIKHHMMCNEEKMHTLMKELGFSVEWGGEQLNEEFNNLPVNIVYVQRDDILGMAPSKFFEKDDNHVCRTIPPFIPQN